MVKRKALPWAPTNVPEIRRQWCNALDALVEHQSSALREPANPAGGGSRRLQRMRAQLTESLAQMSTESQAIRRAELYWVSRDMVDVALDAASALPAWSPAIAAPCPTGVLCWAKPAGVVPWNALSPDDPAEVTWDGVWFYSQTPVVVGLGSRDDWSVYQSSEVACVPM